MKSLKIFFSKSVNQEQIVQMTFHLTFLRTNVLFIQYTWQNVSHLFSNNWRPSNTRYVSIYHCESKLTIFHRPFEVSWIHILKHLLGNKWVDFVWNLSWSIHKLEVFKWMPSIDLMTDKQGKNTLKIMFLRNDYVLLLKPNIRFQGSSNIFKSWAKF